VNSKLYKRLLVRFILYAIFGFIFIVVVPRVAKMLWPFILALIVASVVVGIANKLNELLGRINKKIKLPSKLTTSVLNIMVLFAVSLAVYWVSYTIVKEVISVASSIQQNWSHITATYDQLVEELAVHVQGLSPQLESILADMKDSVLVFVQNLSKNVVSFTVSTTASGITSTGTFLINVLTFALALFFISLDFNRIADTLQKIANRRIKETLSTLKSSVIMAAGGYLKAQLILASFAFLFMLTALTIYGQPYALTIALFLGLIDLLPVIGTIAILLPWGGIELFLGDLNKGLFLLILGVGFFLVRKVVEPKVMGDQTGLPPLLVLFSTYVGLQVFGGWGVLLGPLVLMLLIALVKSGVFAGTVADIKEAYSALSKWMNSEE
jgi:sporulation integral membrane protein YtvI